MALAGTRSSIPVARPASGMGRRSSPAARPLLLATSGFRGPCGAARHRGLRNKRAPEVPRAALDDGDEPPAAGVRGGLSAILRSLTGTKSVAVESEVFLAGASGQTGARVIKALVRGGVAVRAAVPSKEEALALRQAALDFGYLSPSDARKIEIVECKFSDGSEDEIKRSIGRCKKVVVTVGKGENGPSGTFTDAMAIALVRAAEASAVTDVVAVLPKGGGGGGGGMSERLIQKLAGIRRNSGDLVRQALEAATSVDFTILYPTRLVSDDTSPFNHPVIGAVKGSVVERDAEHVSRAQLADALAVVLAHRGIARNKALRVSSSPRLPELAMEDQIASVAPALPPRAGTRAVTVVGHGSPSPAATSNDLERASAEAVGDYGGLGGDAEGGKSLFGDTLAPLTRLVREKTRPRGIVGGRPKGVPRVPPRVPGFSRAAASAPGLASSPARPSVVEMAIANSRRPVAAPLSRRPDALGRRRSLQQPRRSDFGGGGGGGDTLKKARSAMDVLNARAAEVAAACAKVEEAEKLAEDRAREAAAALREVEGSS